MSVTVASEDRLHPLRSTFDSAIWGLWHLASAVCIPLTLSEVRLDIPIWEMSYQVRASLVSIAVAHLVAAAVLAGIAAWRRRAGFVTVVAVVVATYAVLYAIQQAFGIVHSRSVVVMAAMASFVFLTLSLEMPPRLYRVLIPALVVSTTIMGRVAFAGWPVDDGVSQTVFYDIRLVDTKVRVPAPIRGGALAPLGDAMIVASSAGGFYAITGNPQTLTELPYQAPFNRTEYLDTKIENVYSPEPFRVAGLLMAEDGDRLSVFLTHHYWHGADNCVTVRLSRADTTRGAFLDASAKLDWKTVYETKPCLKMGELKMEQTGGRMVRLNDQTLLLSVGDHGQDGVSAKAMAGQDPNSDYGKTLEIDLTTGKAVIFTLGHRNPQGLARAADGGLWLTEQGPGGGDELNLLRRGLDYGWPKVTYGTEYDELTWPLNAADNRHDGFEMPAMAWVPSLATTALVSVTKDLFPVWKGDLLLASLKGQLLRIRTDGRRVVFAEPLLMNKMRMRDLVEAPDGRIWILQDDGAVSFVEPVPEPPARTKLGPARAGAAAHPGAAIYRNCQVCHRSGESADSVAPDLTGVVGREIASVSGYRYSSALSSLSGEWTPEQLSRFLADPEGFAPGTTMKTEGIKDEETRRLLVEYLAVRGK